MKDTSVIQNEASKMKVQGAPGRSAEAASMSAAHVGDAAKEGDELFLTTLQVKTTTHSLLQVRCVGTGQPICCLPGLGCGDFLFRGIEPYLTANGFQLIQINPRGINGSSPSGSDYEMTDFARDASDVMEALDIDHYHLIGVSMGGLIAQVMATDSARPVQSLTLISSLTGGQSQWLPSFSEDQLRRVFTLPARERYEILTRSTTHPGFQNKCPEFFAEIVKNRQKQAAPFEIYLQQKRAADRFLGTKWPIEKIQSPCLVLTGKDDQIVPLENSRILHQRLKQSRLSFIENAGHLAILEQPQTMASALLDFYANPFTKEITHANQSEKSGRMASL